MNVHRCIDRQVPHKGFTLLELLVVIGIIGVVASVVIVAVKPSKNILSARDAERTSHANQLEKAYLQYLIDKWQLPNDSQIAEGAAGKRPICRGGVTSDTTCVNADLLVPVYLASLPVDVTEPCPNYTGYQVYKKSSRVQVIATWLGTLTATGGCSGGTSSSVASSVASSTAPSSSVASSSVGSAASSSAVGGTGGGGAGGGTTGGTDGGTTGGTTGGTDGGATGGEGGATGGGGDASSEDGGSTISPGGAGL